MNGTYTYDLLGEQLALLAEKCIYWPAQNALLIADIHLGKAGHFRKAGIPIHSTTHKHDLSIIKKLIDRWALAKVIFLGDLFHSAVNQELAPLLSLRRAFPSVAFELVVGNHDAQALSYLSTDFKLHPDRLSAPPFLFTHEPLAHPVGAADGYNLCGHIHPKVLLHGHGKQRMRLPCFYFGKQQGILPAFGQFTGGADIRPAKGEDVFVVAGQAVVPFLGDR